MCKLQNLVVFGLVAFAGEAAWGQDCNGNSTPDLDEVASSAGCPSGTCVAECQPDCNENCLPDGCELSPDDAPENACPTCDPKAPPAPLSECDSDLNRNRIPDSCDPVLTLQACASPAAVEEGMHFFDTTDSVSDGHSPIPTPLGQVNVGNDIWFSFTAPRSGNVKFSTCTNVTFDSVMALYFDDGDLTSCPDICGESGIDFFQMAVDDACPGGGFGTAGEFSRSVTAGDCMVIRVGGFVPAASTPKFGSGVLQIAYECSVDMDCDDSDPSTLDECLDGENLCSHLDFGDVGASCSSGPEIPTLSTWGLIALGLLILTAGTTLVVRRSATETGGLHTPCP